MADFEARDALLKLLGDWTRAKVAEDVFGDTATEAEINRARRLFMTEVHPDKFYETPFAKQAAEAVVLLDKWHQIALKLIADGTYGQRKPPINVVLVRSKKRAYEVWEQIDQDSIANSYRCEYEGKTGVFRVVRSARDDGHIQHEADIATKLRNTGDKFKSFWGYAPEIIETFPMGKPARRAIVYPFEQNLFSLAQIVQAYPYGIDTRDMAWMWRRLLAAIGFFSMNSVVHGHIVPENILYNIKTHGLVMTGWRKPKTPVVTSFSEVLAPEVDPSFPAGAKQDAVVQTDIYMAACCMGFALNGTKGPNPKNISTSTPAEVRNFLRSCMIYKPTARPSNAWDLHEEFGEVLQKLYGPPKFRKFEMPVGRPA
jgi:serine/threonine protein kinase